MNSNKTAKMLDKNGDFSKYGISIEKKSNYSCSWPLHWHNCWELELITEGNGFQILNGTTYNIGVGSIYILNPTDFHEVSLENVTVYNISFPDEMLSADFITAFSGIGGGLIKSVQGAEFEHLKQICEMLLFETSNTLRRGEKACKHLLDLLTIHLLRIFGVANVSSKNDSKKALIGSAVSYINTHFRDNPTLSDTASYLGITPNYLSEEFHSVTGKKYKEYLNEVRLMYAKRLLSSSSLSVTEICFASGFSSLSNFLRVFKAFYGTSPQAMKNSL